MGKHQTKKITTMHTLKYIIPITLCLSFSSIAAVAQTDEDALMMNKQNFCTGLSYNYSSWKNYWEGTFKRNNENLGTVSTQTITLMGNYGISNKLNIMFGLPYMQTKASAGQLKGQRGIQDLSVWIKWMPIEKGVGPGTLSLYTLGGYSTPASRYITDYLPLSIGLHSKNILLRAMVDYQIGSWFATLSGTYIRRSNIFISRDAYYTTVMHYTNEVQMPNATQWQLRAGYRHHGLIAEALLNNFTTQGGFDITKNNMPFPSNTMNATSVGFHFKYENLGISKLSVIGGGHYTLAARNVGQSTSFTAGMFYILNIAKKEKTITSNNQ
jgi:hypothetical protein